MDLRVRFGAAVSSALIGKWTSGGSARRPVGVDALLDVFGGAARLARYRA